MLVLPSQHVYPSGIPSIWTTNDRDNQRERSINTYGDHCWMAEMNMDCAQTGREDGLFWVAASMKNEWDQLTSEDAGRSLAAGRCEGPHGDIDLSKANAPARGHVAK